jgi:hypothetical protein
MALSRVLLAECSLGGDPWPPAFVDGLAVAAFLEAGVASSAKLPLTVNAPTTRIADRQKPSLKLFSL